MFSTFRNGFDWDVMDFALFVRILLIRRNQDFNIFFRQIWSFKLSPRRVCWLHIFHQVLNQQSYGLQGSGCVTNDWLFSLTWIADRPKYPKKIFALIYIVDQTQKPQWLQVWFIPLSFQSETFWAYSSIDFFLASHFSFGGNKKLW